MEKNEIKDDPGKKGWKAGTVSGVPDASREEEEHIEMKIARSSF